MTIDQIRLIQKKDRLKLVCHNWLVTKHKSEIKNIIDCFQTVQKDAAKALEEMFEEASKINV
jgi:NAD(P)H-hydrate repair Nnr-like enzyme with NAD(P)H-hydrate dehydratase domain